MRAIGIASAQLIGARVAGQLTYVLAHNKGGALINQRCTIPVYVNSNKGTGRDGSPGRSDQYRLVAWGKLADICVRNLPKGKAIDVICSPHSYEGRVYDGTGTPVLNNTGQPLTIEKVGFTIEKLVFGEESQKEVDLEIQSGKRPLNWNVPNHPDFAAWADILRARQNVQYTGGDTFGYARVIVPSGPGITLANQAPAPAPVVNTTAPVATPVATPVVDGVDPNLVAAITAVLGAQKAAPAPAATAPSEVPF